jgi:hypothetical protein
MYQRITGPANSDLTTGVVGGTGTFDVLMASISAHLGAEYAKGRITGADYTKTYIELVQAALQTALQFVLQADTSYWQTQQAQIAAITGRVQLETAKVQNAAEQYNLTNILPTQVGLVTAQTSQINAETANAQYQLTNILPIQYAVAEYNLATTLPAQTALTTVQTETSNYQLSNILPAQYATAEYQLNSMLPAQLVMVNEQMEAQRAQTLDVRADGSAVAGSIGTQKLLYAQQITSYQRDAEVKASKLFTDAWVTQKTLDDGVTPPNGFTNASLDTILTALKTNNGLT